MPTLDWIGKGKVINHHLDVPYRVLERQYSYDENGQHKGDDRDNSDSKTKLKLSRHWAAQCGGNYRYFMVFDHVNLDGAYTVDDFVDVMKDL